ncbi:hypothetical protein ACN9MF_28260 [Methylobacterium fujisawaense]|uniref:hypothetical protein n=1 Tax=Methylobacterium fujisawaense TaxID=107400 RepID=UPI003CF126AC
MKRPLFGGVAFAPAQRTLDFSGVAGFDVRALLAVIDLSRSALLYAAGKPGCGYTALDGAVLTLAVDTTEMAASDTLLVLYDDGTAVLPTGAATAARQPAFGTAGRASPDVLSVQGVAAGTPIPVALVAQAPGEGGAIARTAYAASAAAAGQLVKGAPGRVVTLTAWNGDTAPVWVKLFDTAAAPGLGTDAAAWEAMVPPGGTLVVPFGALGLSFGAGIAVGFSGAQGRTDATALKAANKAGVSLAVT